METDKIEPVENAQSTQQCPYCKEDILVGAQKCKHCGEFLDPKLRQQRVSEVTPPKTPRWSGGIAAICSLIIPGMGQMYKGQVAKGLIWLVVVVIGYACLIVPGLILHVCCILGAASGDPYKWTN